MMRYVVVPGIVYAGESDEQAQARDNAMLAHNREVDRIYCEATCQKCGFQNTKSAFKTLVPLILKCPRCNAVNNVRVR